MKVYSETGDSSSSIFLTGVILLANIDTSGLVEYAIRAAIGGAIWMLFKVGTDYFSEKVKKTEKWKGGKKSQSGQA